MDFFRQQMEERDGGMKRRSRVPPMHFANTSMHRQSETVKMKGMNGSTKQ